jgi:hypothetical protein
MMIDMPFTTERLAALKARVAELTVIVGDDTPEKIAKSCRNPFNNDDARTIELEHDVRLGNYEELQEAKSRLDEYLSQYA